MKFIINLNRFKPGDCFTCHELDTCVREEWDCPLFNAIPVKRITTAKQLHEQIKKGNIFTEVKPK